MSIFEAALLVGCLLAALVCRFDSRVLLWIGVGIVNYAATSIYYDLGWPYHSFFTAMADASVCLAIYFFGRLRWEMALYRVFQLSVLVSMLQLLGVVTDGYAYALALEVCNWLALLTLMGSGVAKAWGDENGSVWRPSGGFHHAMRSVGAKRASPPFTKTTRT